MARIYTRLIRLRQKLDWSDYLLIASALDALGLIICDTLTYEMGVLDEYDTSVKLSKVRHRFGILEISTHAGIDRSHFPQTISMTLAWVFPS